VYLLSIRVDSTLVIANGDTMFPMLVWIKPSVNRCEYVGTLLVCRTGRQISVEVRDDYDRFQANHPTFVKECVLARSIATALTPERLQRH
jgi:hypothetical protein